VERSLGPGARVVGGRRLTGGVTSSMHRLAVDHGDGRLFQVVLRRWIGAQFDDGETGADRVARECGVLTGLEATDIPAPRVLATDETGDEAGVASLLMTQVPGHVDLTPRDQRRWLAEIVRLLVRIHECDVAARPYWMWIEPDELTPPPWPHAIGAWRAALDALREPPPAYRAHFVHRDYQHFNMLWRRGRLTGIVDWVYACAGPADVDVGHCRVNLAILYSAELADEFLHAYEAEAGRRVDPFWDLSEIVPTGFHDWGEFIPIQVAGRAPFDRAGMAGRLDELVAAAARRL
jgi:aminoglycoside phosphotransferase (APT) family kinase protein